MSRLSTGRPKLQHSGMPNQEEDINLSIATQQVCNDAKASTDSSTERCFQADQPNYHTIIELLEAMKKPEVHDIKPRSAKIVWTIPPVRDASAELKDNVREFTFCYELQLSKTKKDRGKYHIVYSGKDQRYVLTDLSPATDYNIKIFATCDEERSKSPEVTSFRTSSCPPDAPAPPKLQSRTKNSLQLKWIAPNENGEKIMTYHLEFNEVEHGSGFRVAASISHKQFKLQKLLPSHGYLFRLSAENKLGKSTWSSTVRFFTSGTVPSIPDPPRLVKAEVNSLTVAWTKPPGDVSGYTLEMNDETTGYGFQPVYDGHDYLKFTITGLTKSSHYKFKLLAYNDEGKSKFSEVVSYKTCPDKPRAPGKPRLAGHAHSKFFKIAWAPPSDDGGSEVSDYIVEMSKEKGSPMEVVYSGLEQECQVENLEPGHTYRLRVFCLTKGGSSMPSELLMVTTAAVAPGPCKKPLLAMSPKSTCLSLKWEPPPFTGGAKIDVYELDCIEADQQSLSRPRLVYKGSALSSTVGQLRPGTKYVFSVRACNVAGVGALSERLEAETSPGAPEKLSVPVATVLNSTTIRLQWKPSDCNGAEITGYLLHWGGTEEAMSVYEVTQVLSYEIKRLHPNTTYYFGIQAVNSAGPSSASDVGCVTTPPSCPNVVENLRLCEMADDDSTTQAVMASQVMVQWNKPSDNGSPISGYTVQVRRRESKPPVVDSRNADGSLSRFLIDDLSPDTEYNIKVCAINEIGSGLYSKPLNVRTKPLPPDAPEIKCLQVTASYLKLSWLDEAKFSAETVFLLQMKDKHGRFTTIYKGPNSSHKVSKLNENTSYQFRINASNCEGSSPFSNVLEFTTQFHLPLVLQAPVVTDVTSTSCHVTWRKIEPLKKDPVFYRVCLKKVGHSTSNVYTCDFSRCTLSHLSPKTKYNIQITPVRRHSSFNAFPALTSGSSSDTDEDNGLLLEGPPGHTSTFTTLLSDGHEVTNIRDVPSLTHWPEEFSVVDESSCSKRSDDEEEAASDYVKAAVNEPMSEDRRALLLVLFFFFCAIVVAVSVQHYFIT